ncbi:MAG TPA: ABC transporter permease [Thermoanaerobaculia bacterium]|jgi:ABC-2 type transport system permease protein|nr:ABC transporter permease [Thermoanaerobaculia bacterium]
MSERQHPLAALTRTRLLEFIREPEALFWVFAFPILMAVVLGFAFRDRPPDPVPVGIVAGPPAEELSRALAQPGTVKPALYPSLADGLEALRTGKIALLVEEKGTLVYHFDRTRPDARIARLEVDDAIQRARGRRDPSPASETLVHERGSRYIDFLLPGILGLNLMGTGIWGIGFSIVNARLKKTLKLMVATPMRKSDYLLAQILSRFVFLVVEVGLILAFGVVAFQVPIRGGLGLLGAVTILGALCFAGIGLLVVARARTLEAASGLMNLVMVPMWLLSGVFFSSERFPKVAQPLIQALPLTALNNALRAVMLEGRSLPAIAGELAVIAAWGLVSFAIALKIFRWQ